MRMFHVEGKNKSYTYGRSMTEEEQNVYFTGLDKRSAEGSITTQRYREHVSYHGIQERDGKAL